jgi:hypothetical protein
LVIIFENYAFWLFFATEIERREATSFADWSYIYEQESSCRLSPYAPSTEQRGKRQILSLSFWNFLKNIKIIDKKLMFAEKYKIFQIKTSRNRNRYFSDFLYFTYLRAFSLQRPFSSLAIVIRVKPIIQCIVLHY